MNKKLLFAFSILSGIGFSQSFDANNEFAIGATQTMFMVDSSANSLTTATGTGVTWDYSTTYKLPMTDPNRTYTVVANSNTTDYGMNTNKVVDIQSILTTFLETNTNGREIVGIEYNSQNVTFGTVKINFNGGDKISQMTYPFALDDQINDICQGTISSNLFAPTAANGTSVSSFDGIGTLKLSGGVTLANVSRHHINIDIEAQILISGQTVNVTVIIDQYDYFDLSNTNKLPAFSFVNVKLISTGFIALNNSLNFVLSSIDPVGYVGITEVVEKTNFSIFPSPAKNTITVVSDKFSGNEVFELSTLEGKVLLNSTSNNINVAQLPTGMYVVSTTINGVVTKQKFMKE